MSNLYETSPLPQESSWWSLNQQYGIQRGAQKYLWRNFNSSNQSDFLGIFAIPWVAKTLFFCTQYCKSLGYHRKNDKIAMSKCKNECRINIKQIKKGKYKIPPAEANIPEPDIADIEEGAKADRLSGTPPEGEKSNTGLIVGGIVAFLFLIAIVIVFFKFFGKEKESK